MVSEDGSPITNIHIRPKILSGNMSLNWEYFEETFNSYAVLMGYGRVDVPEPTKELAKLKCVLQKETRLVLKNTVSWSETDNNDDPSQNIKELRDYYAGTKNVILEKVEFNELKRIQTKHIKSWQTSCGNVSTVFSLNQN